MRRPAFSKYDSPRLWNDRRPKRMFNKLGSLTKIGFQGHPSFLSNQEYAPTLTLPRRERELIKHSLTVPACAAPVAP